MRGAPLRPSPLLAVLWLLWIAGSAIAQDTAPLQSPQDGPLERRGFLDSTLKRINPSDHDYGAAYERIKSGLETELLSDRRLQAIAALGAVSAGLLFFAWVQRRDRKAVIRIASVFLADLYNDMELARVHAERMTDRYNHHMDSCNQATDTPPAEGGNGGQVTALRKEVATKSAELLRLKDYIRKMKAAAGPAQQSIRWNEPPPPAPEPSSEKRIAELETALKDSKEKQQAASDYIAKLKAENERLSGRSAGNGQPHSGA